MLTTVLICLVYVIGMPLTAFLVAKTSDWISPLLAGIFWPITAWCALFVGFMMFIVFLVESKNSPLKLADAKIREILNRS